MDQTSPSGDDAHDVIVCGGGSAGCVLAARLSEDPGRRVLLLEAGADHLPGQEPADVRSSYHQVAVYNRDYLWTGLKVATRAAPHNRPDEPVPLRSYEQARVIGGGSTINGQLANRGLPSDYDGWAAEGAAGWSWSEVLPFFRRLERDCDFGETELHGGSGPIPVRRIPRERWAPHSLAAAAAWEQSGLPHLPDQNGDFRDGWFAITASNAPEDHRVSAAMGYLDEKTRARPNLTILARHAVLGLDFEEERVTAVRARAPDGAERRLAVRGEVVVSMGALRSPAFLMTQGIGPGEALREAGVALRRELPGVGRNLQEHPTVGLAAYLRHRDRQHVLLQRNIHVGVRWSSGEEGTPAGDLFAIPVARTSWHAVGARLAGLQAWLNRSYSTGRVRLASPDPAAHPRVNLDLLSDRRDVTRLMGVFRTVAGWHETPGLRAVALDPFPMVYNEAVRKVAVKSLRNRVATEILGRILDGPARLRRAAIFRLITEANPMEALLADEELLEAHVRANATGQWHCSGTCRMGRDDDPAAVTDPAGRVRGFANLRVCDASLFPFVPSANTNLPTIMTAEKVAHHLARGD